MSSDPIVERLKEFAACDVSDALLKLKHPHGGFLADIVMYSPQMQSGDTKIVGPAYTVKFVKNNHVNAPKPPNNYIDTVPEGHVVFISGPSSRQVNALYGGLMSLRAKQRGAAGTVIDGRVRDLAEQRSLNYPVFARGSGTVPAGEVARPSEINVPVKLNSDDQEAWIHPGDYIIADVDGVVCLPKELAEQALELMPAIVEADRKAGIDIANGGELAAAFAKHRGK
ncbi:hypothetical protein I317_07706 [Kwoniella heveanensis CBS 569]|uniref:4-hydroxy-4-methyl-2-oxoglutarate aldolase n=1 Tax=Kwoniella heveanensis BCC8398 TaxID=1296120 RepID=A0A1B9GKB5_9TREE|nr:hypothetical protein I316_06839 [Kwoniella heveanensis BCC8398]OCF38525.1 hypothetical protein I317_07706 [Kwoniella heveanensis CBS 569]